MVNLHHRMPGARGRHLARMLRVDHAGETGAVAICCGQRAVFSAVPHMDAADRTVADMEAEERRHLDIFNDLLRTRRVRPSALNPLWNAAGFGLGAVTALMGERAAMVCTQAVEDVIEKHYAGQIDILEQEDGEKELAGTLEQVRQDEIRHMEEAAVCRDRTGNRSGFMEGFLYSFVRSGCRVAIRIAEKV